jgi:hypothetical protein
MSELDTVRWGDQQTLLFTPNLAGPAALIGVTATKQLVNAHWRRPCTWKLLVSIQPFMPSIEASTFHPQMNLFVGCGGANVTIPVAFTVAPAAGVYSPILQFFDLPAQDIQVNFQVSMAGASDDTFPHSWLFAALAAPFTEPDGYTMTSEYIKQLIPSLDSRAVDPANRQLPHWMPPGYEDGELRYRR